MGKGECEGGFAHPEPEVDDQRGRSTEHGNDIHRQCEAKLRGHGFTILASIDIDDTFAEDGLIVARHPSYDGIGPVDLSRRSEYRPD